VPTPAYNPQWPPLANALELLDFWCRPLCEGEPEPRIVGFVLQVGRCLWSCELPYEEASTWRSDDLPGDAQLLKVVISNPRRRWIARLILRAPKRHSSWEIQELGVGGGPRKAPASAQLRREHREILDELRQLRRAMLDGTPREDFGTDDNRRPDPITGLWPPFQQRWLNGRWPALRGDGSPAPVSTLPSLSVVAITGRGADLALLADTILGRHHGLSADRVKELQKQAPRKAKKKSRV
jgi:hypothetical protein